jgi:hypothetical protein
MGSMVEAWAASLGYSVHPDICWVEDIIAYRLDQANSFNLHTRHCGPAGRDLEG